MNTELKTALKAPTPSRVGVARVNMADLFAQAEPKAPVATVVRLETRRETRREIQPSRRFAA